MKNTNQKTTTERVIGYGRVSSREQAFDSHALEQQIERLKTAGAKEIYQDVQSGKRDDRPALEEVMNLVRQGAVNELIITRIDRLARSLIKLRECIEIFLDSGVNLRILDQQIDLSTSQGKLMVNILGALAEWEVDLLSERVQHGKQHRRNQKKACESYPWAYRLVNDLYALDERPFLCLLCDRPKNYLQLYNAEVDRLPGLTVKDVARDCVDIFLQEKGLSRAVKAIFKKYGLSKTRAKKNGADGVLHWTTSGLRNWLLNPVLRGHTVYFKRLTTSEGKRIPKDEKDWQYIYDTHPQHRLISDEEYREIQQIIELSRGEGSPCLYDPPKGNSRYRTYTYQRGLVFCAECGSKCMTKSARYKSRGENKKTLGMYYYYACRYARMGCNNLKSTRKEKIEEVLITTLLEKSLELSKQSVSSEPIPKEKSERLLKLEAKLQTLEQIEDFDPELEKLKAKTRQEIAEEINPLESLQSSF